MKRFVAPALVWLTVSVSAPAVTRYVSATSTNPVPPYTTWATAATTIWQAVAISVSGDEVLVTNGVYTPGNVAGIAITNNITVRSVNGSAVTILDGEGARRCLEIWTNATVAGFTLRNGRAVNGSAVYLTGGGRIENSMFRDNVAQEYGGAVFLAGTGVLENCCFISNTASNYDGGAVYFQQGGAVLNCVAISNSARKAGAFFFEFDGLARNCLVAHNQSTLFDGGAALFFFGGNIENCTLCYNAAAGYGGGVYGGLAGTARVVNTILYFNTAGSGGDNHSSMPSTAFTNCCTSPATGTGCVSNDPQFVAAGSGNFRLQLGSPCVDAGVNLPWMAGGRDLEGALRINGSAPDIGAYEWTPTHYVATNGGHIWPYDSWARAATNLQAAVDAADPGDTVLVSNGVYRPTSETVITQVLTVASTHGPTATVVDLRGFSRCISIYTTAVVRGFTFTGGRADVAGGAYITGGGVLESCIVQRCQAVQTSGGVYVFSNGVLRSCAIIANTAQLLSAGGVWFDYGGSMTHCLVVSNVAQAMGGGVFCSMGGSLTNCLIWGNRAQSWVGGGIYASALSRVENCTIVGNYAGTNGGGRRPGRHGHKLHHLRKYRARRFELQRRRLCFQLLHGSGARHRLCFKRSSVRRCGRRQLPAAIGLAVRGRRHESPVDGQRRRSRGCHAHQRVGLRHRRVRVPLDLRCYKRHLGTSVRYLG